MERDTIIFILSVLSTIGTIMAVVYPIYMDWDRVKKRLYETRYWFYRTPVLILGILFYFYAVFIFVSENDPIYVILMPFTNSFWYLLIGFLYFSISGLLNFFDSKSADGWDRFTNCLSIGVFLIIIRFAWSLYTGANFLWS